MARQQNPFDSNEMAVISEAVRQSGEDADIKMKNFNWLMGAVILALFIGFITLFVSVATMIIDSFHINSAIYKEYSEKNDAIRALQESNKILLETVRQSQKTMEELLNKNNKQ